MNKLTLKSQSKITSTCFLDDFFVNSKNKESFVTQCKDYVSEMDKEFYDHIGKILDRLGFKTHVTRAGDVNCRFDATIIDDTESIPIEIKSPKEDKEVNVKAITQACENKIVLLSRKFYPTKQETTSLAIGFEYPPSRSDIYELVNDIYNAYKINIGIIDITTLLKLAYAVEKEGAVINKKYFNKLKGILEYDKVITKK